MASSIAHKTGSPTTAPGNNAAATTATAFLTTVTADTLGPNHGFRINGLPFLVVGGYPRFQYEGYWISAVDPWPEYWGNDWYDTDDVYVNYVDNGYYLYNRRYPSAELRSTSRCSESTRCSFGRGCTAHEYMNKEQNMLGTILIVILILALFGALPRWSHSREWGYAPTGGVGLVLFVVVILLVLGRI